MSELTLEVASGTFVAIPPLESVKCMLSRCMMGDKRAPADVRFLEILRHHSGAFYSPSRRTVLSSKCRLKMASARADMKFFLLDRSSEVISASLFDCGVCGAADIF